MWLVFAILSALTAGLVALFGKIGLQGIDSTLATTVRSVIMAGFLVLLSLVMGKFSGLGTITHNHKALWFILLSGVAGALSWLFYFFALKNGKVSQVLPIDRLSIVFGIVLAAIFLSEKITLKVALGTLAMVIGSLIIAL